jgi:hypothetical protein
MNNISLQPTLAVALSISCATDKVVIVASKLDCASGLSLVVRFTSPRQIGSGGVMSQPTWRYLHVPLSGDRQQSGRLASLTHLKQRDIVA